MTALDRARHTGDEAVKYETPIDARYEAALDKLPTWKCGRLDMNTYLPKPAQVGRVESDIVRYIYFEDDAEVVVLGQRADEMAYAAAHYRRLKAALLSRDAEVARLREALVRAREDLEATFGWSQHDIRALRAAQGRIDAALEHKP